MMYITKAWISNNLFTKNGRFGLNCKTTEKQWWFNRGFEVLYDDLINKTSFVSPTSKLSERIYCVYNHILSIPLCDNCKENTCNFNSFNDGYYKFCSNKCSTSSVDRNNKIKIKNTINKVDRDIKSKATCMEKYGVEYTFLVPEIQNKVKETKLKRYGDKFYNASHKLKFDLDVEYIADQHFNKKRSYVEIAKELGCGEPAISNRMTKAGYHGQRYNTQSSYERDLRDYLFENGILVNISDRHTIKNTEIDLYLPENKIGIEINGLYWHEEERRSKYHLLEKYNKLKNNGIRLLNIWDSEYINKNEIVLSIINNLLHKNQNKIYARKCTIKELSSFEYREFLNKNHIQGIINSSIRVGLIYNDELVSVMGFGKSRFQQNQMELHRFCNKLNINIIGGASKLFKFVTTQYNFNDVISYCDKRFFTGRLYEELGFELIHETKPNYWYFKGDKLESRLKYQKHKLSKILEQYDENLTEYENMKLNNYKRVFDCGNFVYKLKGND